jgi:putative inorganic carbon (HCO3(-)) transporter
MNSIVLTLFCLLFAYLAWKRPVWAIAFICAFLPSYLIRFKLGWFIPSLSEGVPMTLLEAMILILFAMWLIKQVIGLRFKVSGSSWHWPILAWVAVATIAMFVSPNLRAAAGIWKAYFIEPILLLIVFVSVIQKKKDLRLVFCALGFSALYLSITAIRQKIIGVGYSSLEAWPDVKIVRATGLFVHPNFLGLYLGPLVVLGLGQIITSFKKHLLFTLYCLLFTVLSLLAIVFARSEGALLGIIVGAIFLGLLCRPTRKWTLVGLVILIILISTIVPLRSFVIEKITLQDFSGQIRLNTWRETFQMLKVRPFFGAGLAGYQTIMEKYHQFFFSKELPITLEIHPYPHNIFLSIWSELGLLGLLVFLWILIKFFKQGFKLKIGNWKLKIAIMASMVAIIVHGLVDTPYFKNDLSVLFWLIVGMSILTNLKNFSKL